MNAIKTQLENLFATAEKFKNSYFWSSPGSAGGRRSYEEYYTIPEFSFDYDGHHYTAEFNVTCSCRNIYAKGYYTKDGNKTTITTLKNVYKKLS